MDNFYGGDVVSIKVLPKLHKDIRGKLATVLTWHPGDIYTVALHNGTLAALRAEEMDLVERWESEDARNIS
jgi:hypothetical protein